MNGTAYWSKLRLLFALSLACFASVMTACDRISRTPPTPEDRINAIRPPPPSSDLVVSAARNDLVPDPARARELEERLTARAKVRAVECVNGFTPKSSTSDDEIRTRLVEECFKRHDADTERFLRYWRAGTRAALPALRPIPATPPATIVADGPIFEARFPRFAGVALLSLAKEYQLVEIATGAVIYREIRYGNQQYGPLSDNGRLAVFGEEDRSIWIRSTTTGERLVALPNAAAAYATSWIGSDALLINTNDRRTIVLDLKLGREYPIDQFISQDARSVPSPSDSREPREFFAIGNEIIRQLRLPSSEQDEPKLNMGSDWRFTRRTWSGWDGLSADGSYFVDGASGVTIFDLKGFKQEELSFVPFVQEGVWPGLDPDELVLQLYPFGRINERQLYVYSRANRTLAAVDKSAVRANYFFIVRPVRRLGAILDGQLVLYDALPRATPVPLETAIATVEATSLRPPLGNEIPGRLHGVAAMPGPLTEVARRSFIEAVGVYSAKALPSGTYRGVIEVRVRRSVRPVILVLSAYEQVRWQLNLEPGAELAAVLTSGYQKQIVVGAGNVRIVDLGQEFAYDRKDFAPLEREVFAITGRRIDIFQGRYQANEFTVGGF